MQIAEVFMIASTSLIKLSRDFLEGFSYVFWTLYVEKNEENL